MGKEFKQTVQRKLQMPRKYMYDMQKCSTSLHIFNQLFKNVWIKKPITLFFAIQCGIKK